VISDVDDHLAKVVRQSANRRVGSFQRRSPWQRSGLHERGYDKEAVDSLLANLSDSIDRR